MVQQCTEVNGFDECSRRTKKFCYTHLWFQNLWQESRTLWSSNGFKKLVLEAPLQAMCLHIKVAVWIPFECIVVAHYSCCCCWSLWKQGNYTL